MFNKFTLLICILFHGTTVWAQQGNTEKLSDLITEINNNSTTLGIERLYIHTDKLIYTKGDTLWLKAYLFEAGFLTPSSKSGLIYLEIATDSNILVKRVMLPVQNGIAVGQIPLNDTEFENGKYILRAYTNWMRNFPGQLFFKKEFYINAVGNRHWLIDYKRMPAANPNQVNLQLKFKQFDNQAVASKQLRIAVTNHKRVRFRDQLITGSDGMVNVNFQLAEQADGDQLSLSVEELRNREDDNKLMLPLILNRPENIDLQFMPEGGNLVSGLLSRVAFKAINEDGYGATVSGKIVDNSGREHVLIRSTHKGMGSFEIKPEPGHTYSAIITLPDGHTKSYTLPSPKTSGISLQVINRLTDDSCELLIRGSDDLIAANENYYVVGEARNLVCYGAMIKLTRGGTRLLLHKKTFPTGLVRFTVSNPGKTQLNARIIFIDHRDNLVIHPIPNKTVYTQRDSIGLTIEVKDSEGNPVAGNFSLSVTDDGQGKSDSTQHTGITTQLLLSGELGGHIEDPGYYLQSPVTDERWAHLDQLLLSQGWIGYDWQEMMRLPAGFEFQPEREFVVRGKVINAFNKAVASSPVMLIAKDPVVMVDTITNKDGIFAFHGLIPGDTSAFFIQSKNRKNKSFNVGIEMEEFKAPVFVSPKQRHLPWYVNMDTAVLSNVNRQIALKKQAEELSGVKMLQEVIVISKFAVRGSKNLNGPGGADIIITEEELKKSGQMTLGDLLAKRLAGFGMKVNKSGTKYWASGNQVLHLVIDGVNTEYFRPEGVSMYEYLNHFFNYFDAGEIVGIEIMNTWKNETRYALKFLDPLVISKYDHAFIEVTTRGERGPFLKKAIGTYLYRPIPFILPRQFYSPKYPVAVKPDMTDLRSTIFWDPYIVTGPDGKAFVSFYTADNPGTYSVIIEGSDMDGHIGTKRLSIKIEKRPD